MHGRARHPDPPHGAITSDLLLLDGVGRELAFHLPAEQLPFPVAVIRMGHQREGLANELVSRTARELAVGFADVQDPPILIDFGDAYGRVVVGGAQPFLALPQRLLGPLSLGDVLYDADRIEKVPSRIPYRGTRDAGP